MNSPPRFLSRSACVALSLALNIAAAFAQQPIVRKIDPPNWFAGLPSPMLLIKGEHLEQAKITTSAVGVRVLRVQAQRTETSSDGGHYLFVWLDIAENTPRETVSLRLTTSEGSTAVDFPISPRRPLSDGFKGFDENDVLYLIMPDRFADGDLTNDSPAQSPNTLDRSVARAYHGGDLRGITEHLDYLKMLGVTTIWMTPIVANNPLGRDYHGYGAVDLYSVDSHLGNLQDYQRLVAAAHQHGLKIVLDMVPNHVGPANPWVEDPPDPEWFHGSAKHHLAADANFAPITDPHSLFPEWKNVTEGWFANILPDMNTENPLVKEYLIQNALWWAEEGAADGFRLDTFPYVGRQFWHDFHAALHAAYPNLKTVGECFNSDATIVSYFAGGQTRDGIDTGLDTPFDFPVFSALRSIFTQDAPMQRLTDTLRLDRLYPHPERLVPFEGNHDVKRFLTEAKGDVRRLKLVFSVLLTLRGTPQIYYGDEIGMQGGDDPDNRRDFPGGFPGDGHNAFSQSGKTAQEQDIFSHVQSLLRLRSQHEALRTGDLKDIYVDDTAYVYRRSSAGECILVAVNNSDSTRSITLPLFVKGKLVPLSQGANAASTSAGATLELAARSASIYQIY